MLKFMLFFKSLKFLPNASETFDSGLHQLSLDEILNKLLRGKNILGMPVWSKGKFKDGTYWVRLNEFNKYGLPPKLFIKELCCKDGKYNLNLEIKFAAMGKVILYYWLFLIIVSYSVFFMYFMWEYLFSDGLIIYNENQIETLIPLFPWVFVFIVVHFIGFVVYPVTIITLGWNKTKKLVNKILLLCSQN